MHFNKGKLTQHQNGFVYTSINTPDIQHVIPTKTIKQLSTIDNLLIGHHHLITKLNLYHYDKSKTLLLYTIDKSLFSAPTKSTITIDQMKRPIGFCNVNSILKEIKDISKKIDYIVT